MDKQIIIFMIKVMIEFLKSYIEFLNSKIFQCSKKKFKSNTFHMSSLKRYEHIHVDQTADTWF